MHSIVTTFREAVIKVEVANFGAAIDTLIDQDENPQASDVMLFNMTPGLSKDILWHQIIMTSYYLYLQITTLNTRYIQSEPST